MVDPEALKLQYPQLVRFEIKQSGDDLEFSIDSASVADIEKSHGEFILSCGHGHAHRDTEEDAVNLLVSMLCGSGRWVEEFRGEMPAAAWIESKVDDAWERHDISISLAPFDPDDWSLWPDEKWKTVRTTWVVDEDGKFEKKTAERESDRSTFHPEKMLEWLNTALGPPANDMKWTVGRDNRLVLQIPRGFRRVTKPDAKKTHVDFASQRFGIVIRAQNYYRPSADPKEERRVSMKPTTREFKHEDATPDNGGWSRDSWTLTYAGDQDDMQAVISVYEHESAAGHAEHVRRLIIDTVDDARYVPNNWDMSAEPK